MLSMKFPHLFLRPEIIITFLWGWEWSGGQVRHRSPRNSGSVNVLLLWLQNADQWRPDYRVVTNEKPRNKELFGSDQ